MREVMLTTIDNPFDPFDQWIEWFGYDRSKNYHTPQLLAHVTNTSIDLPQTEQLKDIEEAIDQIVETNPSGLYMKVVRERNQAEKVLGP